jgi:Peptidase family M28
VSAWWIARLGLAVALVAIAWFAALPVIPPDPVPTTAPKDAFSAERAMEELRVVARAPHPAGSAAQGRVREYILARANTLGLPAEVQRRSGVESSMWGGWSGTVENVIVRVPGTRGSTPDVLITAHYDSVPVGPGAGDDGVSVAAMLETMRALKAGPPLKNDVVFLFTDGEEMGWLGAKAFAEQHPEMGNIGVAFAFEGWPESGPTEMRATSPGDAWLVRQLSVAAPPVWATSTYNTDERLYHGSDFGVLAASGLLSAEFENSGSATRHHRPGDTLEAIDPGIVQDHGDTMLTLARYFGNLDLSRAHRSSEDLVFFTLPGFGLITYPTWLATVLSIVAVVLLVVIIVVGRRGGRLSIARLAWGTLAFFAVVLVGVAIAGGIWELLLAIHPEAEELSYPDFEGSGLAMATVYALAGAAFIAVTHTISRRIGAVELAAGALLWWAVVALTLGFFAPLASALAIWPLLGGTVALAVVSFLQRPWAAALLALAAVPSLVLFVPLLVLNALQPEDGAAEPVALVLLVLGTLLVQLMLITGRLPDELKD